MAKKRAIIAEIIRKLTEEQRMGEVVSWPKISFLPSETDVLRGSQLWETLEEEVPKAELPSRSTRAKRTTEVAPQNSKLKPSVVPQLKKGVCPSEWEFPDFEDEISASQKSRGRGSRGRLGGGKEGLGQRGKSGRGRGRGGRGGRGINGTSLGVNIVPFDYVQGVQEGQKAVDSKSRRGGNRGRRGSTRGNGDRGGKGGIGNIEQHKYVAEAGVAEDWKFKTAAERSSEQMNDVLLRVTSREANLGKFFLKELEVGKQNGAALLHRASGWVAFVGKVAHYWFNCRVNTAKY